MPAAKRAASSSRALPNRARPPAPRDRSLLLADPGAPTRRRATRPEPVRRRARRLRAGARAPLRAGPAAGLGRPLRQRLRDDAPGRGLGRDVLPLPPHPRHAADRRRLPAAGARARRPSPPSAGRDLRLDAARRPAIVRGDPRPTGCRSPTRSTRSTAAWAARPLPVRAPAPWSRSSTFVHDLVDGAVLAERPAACGVGCGSMGEIPELLDKLSARAVAVRLRGAGSGASGAKPPRSPSSRPTGSARRSRRSASEDAKPLLAVVGHIDEIGLVITHVDEKGFLYFTPIGGWDAADPRRPAGRGRRRATAPCPASSGASRSTCSRTSSARRRSSSTACTSTSAPPIATEALELLRIGDPVVIAPSRSRSPASRLVSRSMDNRLGAYVALESLRRCHERGGHEASDGRRRLGPGGDRAQRRADQRLRGRARRSRSRSTSPTPPTRPGVEEKEHGSHPLGSGPVIGRGSTLVAEGLRAALRDRRAAPGSSTRSRPPGRCTGTDADAIQISRAGIPTGLVIDPAALHALAGRDGRPRRPRGGGRAGRRLRRVARRRASTSAR